jgi:type IV secretory pathway VirB9-like protein
LGNEVCDVWNVAYDPVGQNPGTGTTSPEVVRTVKGAHQ